MLAVKYTNLANETEQYFKFTSTALIKRLRKLNTITDSVRTAQ